RNHHVCESARPLQSQAAGHRIPLQPADLECGRWDIVHEHIHPSAGDDDLDVVPPGFPKRRPVFILRIQVPEQDPMRLRRVLDAGPEGRTVRIGPEVQQLEVLVVLLTKGDSGCAPPYRIDVELDRSVAERDALEYRIAAVQPHQAVEETQLPKEL